MLVQDDGCCEKTLVSISCENIVLEAIVPFKHLLLRQQEAEARFNQAKPEARNKACFMMKPKVVSVKNDWSEW